jgi:hypothetical protein
VLVDLPQSAAVARLDAVVLVVRQRRYDRDAMPARGELLGQLRHDHSVRDSIGRKMQRQQQNSHAAPYDRSAYTMASPAAKPILDASHRDNASHVYIAGRTTLLLFGLNLHAKPQSPMEPSAARNRRLGACLACDGYLPVCVDDAF